MKTMQETFDLVVEHLASQKGVRSLNFSGACSYRGDNGNKCAIGALIPDELWDEVSGGKGLNSQSFIVMVNECHEISEYFHSEYPTLFEKMPDKGAARFGLTFGGSLQFIHDKTAVKERPNDLKELAGYLNLSTAKIEELSWEVETSEPDNT